MNQDTQLYLASTSPRRAALLQQAGYTFETLAVDIDETPLSDETAADFVQRMALEKARTGWLHQQRSQVLPVLGSDTAVVLDGEIFGKPQDQEHAMAMLQRLSARCHQVMTAVAIKLEQEEVVRLSTSEVCFRQLSRGEIESYWSTGEPEGKAGGYAIQGRAALFIQHLRGSYSAVMGLPIYETGELLADLGVLSWVGQSRHK